MVENTACNHYTHLERRERKKYREENTRNRRKYGLWNYCSVYTRARILETIFVMLLCLFCVESWWINCTGVSGKRNKDIVNGFFYNTEFVSLIVARPIDNNGEKRFNCTEFVHLGFFSWGRFLCPPEGNSILCLVIFRDRRWNLSVFFLFVLCIFVVDDFVTILFHIPQRVCQLASVKNLHFSLYFIQNILWQILWFSVILSLLIFIFFFSFVIFFIIFCILRDIVSYTSIHRFIQSKPESFGNFLPLNGQSQHSLDKHTSNT